MSQNNFAGGFIAGTFVGGIIGGIVGVLASNRLRADETDTFAPMSEDNRRHFEAASNEEKMEIARRGLEDKISQLNMAIEDARLQMGKVNGDAPNGQTSPGLETSSPDQSIQARNDLIL